MMPLHQQASSAPVLGSGVVWRGVECRGQKPRGCIRDNCEEKELKPTVLIAPDRNHTEAVRIVTAAENNATSRYRFVILTTLTS